MKEVMGSTNFFALYNNYWSNKSTDECLLVAHESWNQRSGACGISPFHSVLMFTENLEEIANRQRNFTLFSKQLDAKKIIKQIKNRLRKHQQIFDQPILSINILFNTVEFNLKYIFTFIFNSCL